MEEENSKLRAEVKLVRGLPCDKNNMLEYIYSNEIYRSYGAWSHVTTSSIKENNKMEQYEYKTLTTDAKGFLGGKVNEVTFENEMNKLGQQGWELVNTVATAQSYGSTRWIISIFKRKIQ